MILSKREKYIAIAVAAAVGLLALDSLAIEPYLAQRSAISDQVDADAQKLQDAASMFNRKESLNKIWTAMQTNGLKTDEASADSQLQHALLDWAGAAGASTQILKSDLPKKEGVFTVIGYRVTASGSMRSLSQFLWDLETATIPIRVTDVRMTPQREGTDELSIQVGVSTLCAPPDAVTTQPVATAGAGAAGVGL